MRFKVKNISIITALVLALSLCISLVSFGATERIFVYKLHAFYGSFASNSYDVSDVESYSFASINQNTPVGKAVYINSGSGLGENSFASLVLDTDVDLPSGYTLKITGYTNASTSFAIPYNGLFPATWDTPSIFGSGIGLANDSGMYLVSSNAHRPFDTVSASYVDSGNGYYWTDFTFEYTADQTFPLDISLSFRTPNIGYLSMTVNTVQLISPDDKVIDVVQDGFNVLYSGWSGSGMNNSNTELGGALGDLDDMQQNADNDLHDALGDLESPTVDFNGNAVSFITSSVAMLWGSLGGFSAVLLCALFITVFNFISRYRGS